MTPTQPPGLQDDIRTGWPPDGSKTPNAKLSGPNGPQEKQR